ncbi:MAG: helix-turn-helix domain-containing protein [Clostridiaceae bacterium]|nr:helix-turn-helix domain-containing protein [Clostridiaceae bacterium]
MFRISEYALYAEQILLDIQESIQNSLQNFGRNIIIEVKAYIEKNYSDPDLRLHKIAEIFFINYSYLSAIFKEETGESFSAYLTNIRLKEARRLLENTSLPVKEVAGRVGYADPKYFYQVFRRNYGYAPGSMRDTSTRKKSP